MAEGEQQKAREAAALANAEAGATREREQARVRAAAEEAERRNAAARAAFEGEQAARAAVEAEAFQAREAAAQVAAKDAAQKATEQEARRAAVRAREETEAKKAREIAAAKAEADAIKAREESARVKLQVELMQVAARAKADAASADRVATQSPGAGGAAKTPATLATASAANPSESSLYRILEVGSIRTRYRKAGSGKEILLLHDWGASVESLTTIVEGMAVNYAVTAVEFPGHGESGRPSAAWNIKDFATWLLVAMDELELHAPDIIGHSFGGRVAVQLASDHAGRVGKLILVNTTALDSGRKPENGSKGAGAARSTASKPSFKNKFFSQAPAGDQGQEEEITAAPAQGAPDDDLSPQLEALQSPSLLVWGENEGDGSIAENTTKLIPKGELVVLKNAGHFAFSDQPAMFKLVTNRFLRDGTLGPPPKIRK